MKAADITAMATRATKKWAKQRKAEERDARAAARRDTMFSGRTAHTQVAHLILPNAYAKVSDNGRLPAAQRQLFYASRDQFWEKTGEQITWENFSNKILRKYLRCPETQHWKVTRDARGTLIEPHTKKRVPVGTLQIDDYLAKCCDEIDDVEIEPFKTNVPTRGPVNRFQALLYIEKEGFNPLFEAVKLADRFDIAIMSCKGQSVIAARKLVDEFCHDGGIPLLVLHDFDRQGFSIKQCLSEVSDAAEESDLVAYRFENEINVIDLGLRLTDIEKWKLKPERVRFKGYFEPAWGLTEAEKKFLRGNQRVELNEFTSADFVAFVEEKLRGAGISEKFVPDDDALETAYRRAHLVAAVNKAVADVREQAEQDAEKLKVPKSLRAKLRKALKATPEKSWDAALFDIVSAEIDDE